MRFLNNSYRQLARHQASLRVTRRARRPTVAGERSQADLAAAASILADVVEKDEEA